MMADCFTQFSEALVLNGPGDLERAFAIFAAFEANGIGSELEPPDFCLSVFAGSRQPALHIQDDAGSGNPEHVMLFVEAVAAACSLTDRWGCTWAYTCSKSRIGAFGGGACVIDFDTGTRNEVDLGDWAERLIRAGDPLPAACSTDTTHPGAEAPSATISSKEGTDHVGQP